MIPALALLLTAIVLAAWSYRALGLRRYGMAMATAVLGSWVVIASVVVAANALVRPGG